LKHLKANQPFQYLGFLFDGENISTRNCIKNILTWETINKGL